MTLFAKHRRLPPRATSWRLTITAALAAGAVATTCGPSIAAASAATTARPAGDVCAVMAEAVYQRVNPASGDSTLTTSRSAADTAHDSGGYSDDDGVAFLASASKRSGLDRVRHLKHRVTGWNAYASGPERIADLKRTGYAMQRDSFFASSQADACLDPVYELVRATDAQQQLATTAGQRDEFVARGYTDTGVAFFAATDTTFGLAVIPDTQLEVHVDRPMDLFADRAEWLAANKEALDLRYITHTGDVVDWDTPGHEQYEIAARGVGVLDAASVPYSFAIGNHDTMATDVGGSARPGQNTRANQLITATFNSYFGVGHVENLRETFEENKVDNSYSTFAAGGRDWLVLNLELWPREEAVAWATQVVAGHPGHNVVVVTHSFLEANGSIKQGNGGYGHTSPQYVFDQLIAPYPNVRFVFSGHTGSWAYNERTGVAGNPVHLIQTAYHDWNSNPTRILEIDTANDSFSTRVFSPYTGVDKQDGSTFSRAGLQLVG